MVNTLKAAKELREESHEEALVVGAMNYLFVGAIATYLPH
jgi:hypothetical protein